MIDSFIIPENTVLRGKGESGAVEVTPANAPVFLLTLQISEVVEQEALDVAIYGSADGTAWGEKPLVAFPQQFYAGEVPLLMDLARQPEIRFVRARWEANRWGRGSMETMFKAGLRIREVPQEVLQDSSVFKRA